MTVMPSSAQKNSGQTDSLVRLMKGASLELIEKDGVNYRKAIDATFLHNGTYLICDTALWNVDEKVINAVGHVQVIQDETKLTSEKMDYFIDDNLVKFRGSLVQLENRQKNILRTRHLDYNTKDSIAVFAEGAAMRDKDGQIIESIDGTYDSRARIFNFTNDVNMFTDSVFVKTSSLRYEANPNMVWFNSYIDFWKDGNMLSADTGWYDRGSEVFFFRGSVHALSENQEAWSDTLYFYRGVGDVKMLGDAQVQDTTRNVAAMADYIFYQDSLSKVTMRNRAAVALRTEQESGVDTVYFGADSLVYLTLMKFEIPESEVKTAQERLADMFVDPVLEYRQKAAKEAAERAAAAAEKDVNLKNRAVGEAKANQAAKAAASKDSSATGGPLAGSNLPPERGTEGVKTVAEPTAPLAGSNLPPERGTEGVKTVAEPTAPAVPTASLDSTAVKSLPDSISAPQLPDSISVKSLPDSTAVPAPIDSTISAEPVSLDSIDVVAAPLDSTAAPAVDSLVAEAPKDSTKVGFLTCVHNVKVFRQDMQVLCDSLVYSELDSIARFYIDPIVWNDGNRQYTSDSLFVLPKEGGLDRASLLSNAFIITQEDSTYFDQIKGAEVMAYFDTTSALRRFDALGGANALFYLVENDALATVNKVESKMLTATLKDGEVERVYYFEEPKNNAYPIVQLPPDEHRMKGFDWKPDLRPADRYDVSDLEVKPSERSAYLRHPRTKFKYTDRYFPGYMAGVYKDIALRDSLRKAPKPVRVPEDSLAVRDTMDFTADSLLTAKDSLSSVAIIADSLSVAADSLKTPADSLKAPADSIAAAADSAAVDPLSVPTVDPKQAKREKREEARKLRIAARDARWAELDARDAAKAEAERQKALEKKRAKTRAAILRQQKQDARDEAKLQKYIDRYERKKLESARKRPQGVEAGGELPPPPEPGIETVGSDPVLRDDGSVDDRHILSGGRISRP